MFLLGRFVPLHSEFKQLKLLKKGNIQASQTNGKERGTNNTPRIGAYLARPLSGLKFLLVGTQQLPHGREQPDGLLWQPDQEGAILPWPGSLIRCQLLVLGLHPVHSPQEGRETPKSYEEAGKLGVTGCSPILWQGQADTTQIYLWKAIIRPSDHTFYPVSICN